MSDTTYTHKDLSSLLGVSETTVKSYRRKFPGCIPVASKGKPIRFTDEALAVTTRIRDLFETGMSVNDVRSRLAAEFAFIDEDTPQEGGARSGKSDVSPELSLGVSNMAKSMVAMTQQQKAILSRMQGIEGMLEEFGLQGDFGQSPRAEKARAREALIESRLDTLDANTRELARTVQNLAGELNRFLGRREKAAEEWPGSSAQTVSDAARLAAWTIDPSVREAVVQERQSAQIIPLRPDKKPDLQRPDSNLVPGQAVVPEGPSEPPRQFFGLPLVARTEQGQYISAGGKSRGRFSLNDLKAMLIYGFTPPNHFTLRWERHGQGWWLYMEQENSDRAIHLLLMELPTHKGGSVVEILQIRQGDEVMHPAEICTIIDSFGV